MGEPFDHHPLPGFHVRLGLANLKIGSNNAQKRHDPFPVAGLIGDVQAFDHLGRHAFAVHFIHQAGKAVRQIVKRRAGRKIGGLVQQLFDQSQEFQPPPQGRDRIGQVGHGPILAQIGDK